MRLLIASLCFFLMIASALGLPPAPRRFVRQADPSATPPAQLKENSRCNSEALEKVMLENIGDDAKQSKLKIMEAAEALLGGTFNVVCSHGDFSFITSTRLYCLTGNGVKCYAFLADTSRSLGQRL
ncbi:Ground-like domain-containing protein [Aphelenchoides fujianensis]|nr:Ground-like domain-containing protein [Aphelenchoides fujianensis]